MGFQWPLALLALLVVPALAGAYVWQLRRRRRRAVRYSSVALIRAAAPRRAAWKRHAPIALLLGALALLGLAAARPQVRADVPVSRSAIILALDVSGSMCSTDVEPNRLSAAQAAVREFVQAQDATTSIGLVLFSGFAQVAVAPTTEREPLTRAIDSLTTGRGTTIGAAILKSVDAIAEINPAVEPADPTAALGNDDAEAPGPARPPVRAEGDFAPEIVVLLTDGANTSGIEPVEAAQMAGERGVRVYPIGFGTRDPASMVCTPAQAAGQGTSGWGSAGGPGGRSFLVADEPTLREVAEVTGGEYFAAADADRLQEVLRDLPRTVAIQQREVEVSVGLVGLAVLLVGAGVWAAARWTAFPS
ncbi:VWA domain-containing protein [Pseudonocardia humida]|uniref:VWA domain-containing protein n=1 Tax=Pseudonocardia humida TaxID=2800819 RepID=A0ABT1A9F9_9PSEU|nr:VWA domain-containing protein [Pseudonocardia humida]MCO1659672.1 VWA domain-containing protein [Pseudonocardia humida]